MFHPELLEIGRRAKQAARQLAFASTESKNKRSARDVRSSYQ